MTKTQYCDNTTLFKKHTIILFQNVQFHSSSSHIPFVYDEKKVYVYMYIYI